MGSFEYKCAISGLPIGAGDKVRFLLLQSSPFSSRGNYADGELSWYLRSLPVRAVYNDYGTVEEICPADLPITNNWLEGLKIDLVEKGWGDNTCHDVPTRKGMSFDELREALWEERLEVRPQLESRKDRVRSLAKKFLKERTKKSKGIPTIRRIERCITKAGTVRYMVNADHVIRGPGGQKYQWTPPAEEKNYLPIVDPHQGFGGKRVEDVTPSNLFEETFELDLTQLGNENHKFIVDELRRGEVRVRVGGFQSDFEELLRLNGLARKLRRRFSVMLSPGEYGNPCLLVHPKPGALDGEHRFDFHNRHGKKEPKHLHLAQAMVREDVWQSLCDMKSEFWDKNHKTVPGNLDLFRKLAREAWDVYRTEYMPIPPVEGEDQTKTILRRYRGMWEHFGHSTNNPIGYFTGNNPSISGFGMDVSWKLFAERTDLTEADVENILDVLAQTVIVNGVIHALGMPWHPSGTLGPQYGEWKKHRQFHAKILRIAKRQIFREALCRAEDKGWSKCWDRMEKEKKKKAAAKRAKARKEKAAEG